MIPDDLDKYIESLRADRLRLQQLRQITEERLISLTERMAQIEAERLEAKIATPDDLSKEL